MGKELQPMDISSPGQNLESYLNSIQNIAILTPQEEKKLAEELYYNNDLEAARKLVMAHLRFVAHVARGYSGYGLPQADLIQEGNVGLMKAVRKFNPEVGVRLISFAIHWIKSEIHEYVLKNWKIVKVATTKAQRKLFFNLRNKRKDLNWLSSDDVKMISAELGVDEKSVKEMESRMNSSDVSFDPPAEANDDQASYSPANYISDSSMDPAELVEKNDLEKHNNSELLSAISELDQRSKEILMDRWLSDMKPTLHELSDKYGVSAERIRQIEKSVKEMESRMNSSDVSFDPPAEANDDQASYSPANYISDSSMDPAELIEKNDLEKHNNSELLSAISELDQRSKEILMDRWLSDMKPTLHELSDKYGVSAERIRQIEKSAMDVIKEKLS